MPSSLRVRTTIAATGVVGIGLVMGAVALVASVDQSLTSNVRALTVARAAQIAADPGVVGLRGSEEEFVQVLDAGGAVVAASDNVAGHPALAAIGPGEESTLEEVPFEDERFLVTAVAAADGSTVVVGRSLDDIADARAAIIVGLAIGIPALVALVGVVTWAIVGRALGPVESMRREVEAISARALDRRLALPEGDDEIARLAATLNRMLERLEDAQRRQRRFVADASHELRSPLASIRQHVEVAREHPGDADLAHLTEVVLEEESRLQTLVEDLLLLTRLDEGASPERSEQVDLDDLALAEAARLRADGVVEVDTHGIGAARVTGDPAQLERAVRNLGNNAARHARRRIAIATSAGDGRVVLTVDDDGPGIPADLRERAFERFVRLDESRSRDDGGVGLGLAIVREIVRAHDGEVQMLDTPLGGLRVEIRLPSVGSAFSEASGAPSHDGS